MKSYPSIPNCNGQGFRGLGVVDVFDKLDGSNMRFEFSRKRGWYKAGCRNRMIDATDPQFGDAFTWFHENLGDAIIECFKKVPQRLIVFGEWWGPQSFAGIHEPGDDMRITLFDATTNGWMSPSEFRKTFEGKVDTAKHLGQYNWTRGYIQRVRDGEQHDVTGEGVVGKTLQGGQLLMGKAKTQEWLDRIYERFDEDQARKLAAS